MRLPLASLAPTALALVALLACARSAGAEPAAPPHATLTAAEIETLRATHAAAAADPAYDPRTELLDAEGAPRFVNRLILETSPYLRQHAHNPVDWRPWSAETLAEAQRLDRPIFLSVGYAACHWCHVMEAESFDTLAVAEALNRDFVPIKVDREALPAVDAAYMRATELIAGAGGWPNSVWLTPEGAPVFARTYLPQADLLTVLETIASGWAEDREGLRALAARVTQALEEAASVESRGDAALDAGIRAAAAETLLARHNDLSGGFSETAQFPITPWLSFLLDHWRRTGDVDALEAVTLTLDEIVAGGMHDHVGGGFHRYTVDPDWAQPHFEKMLYNQAQLARLLTEAWEATGHAPWRRAAERTLDYVLRDMTAPGGGFFSAEDADSAPQPGAERIEGAFYAWSDAEVAAVLTPDMAARVRETLSLGAPPLIEAGPTPRASADSLDALAGLDPALERLRTARDRRPRPLRDEKIIAGWNGLMIAALADASVALDRPQDLVAARAAAEALWTGLWEPPAGDRPHGRLMRFMSGGRVDPTPGALTDYAWTALGFIALADAGAGGLWIERAMLLAEAALARFDAGDGRLALSEAATPLGPLFETDDSTLPTGESSLLEAFARLARREQGLMAEDKARALLAGLTPLLVAPPADRVTALGAGAMLEDGESAHRRAMARGVVHVTARRSGADLEIRLVIDEGWHVNAHEPHDDMLIPTAIEGATLSDAVYPTPHDVALGFSDAPLSVIEGRVAIRARLEPEAEAVEASLTLQACSTEICLEPERALFRFASHDAD